ncbi:hypothetical protein O1C20_003569 [Vibrio cholerae]|uniref:hypothetical protein n=1 Tax=Vibrio cholerae TaxID=666 RepID=UPI00048ED04A|nr:hypothetical protein [Vibrio cholerae]EGR4126373.1 hypothetical protein [Vibrio cholerae]EJL6539069.1 hypothetical protein [Vibrio cholerae]EKF9262652.1 hypothetical protein [Vibrio cholerae]EKF9501397.1 hypothetical protein [Vibrio cholerae]EKF9918402.1 hypothetical protein [Vibrio cholerae]
MRIRSIKNYSSTIVELLTSISIISAGFIYVFDYVNGGLTDIKGVVVFSAGNKASLLLTNSGGNDVAIRSARIVVPTHDIKNNILFKETGFLLKSGETILLSSEESRLYSSVVYNPEHFPIDAVVGTIKCNVFVDYIDINGKLDSLTIPQTCFAGSYFGP